MNTAKEINEFFSAGKIAFAGVSGNPKKFSNMAFRELTKKGFELVPVNPNQAEIEGARCYDCVASLPEGVDSVLIMTPKDQTPKVIREIGSKGIKNVWIQQGAHSEEAENLAKELGMNLVNNKCIMMYSTPVKGIHRFHRTIVKLFGGLPA